MKAPGDAETALAQVLKEVPSAAQQQKNGGGDGRKLSAAERVVADMVAAHEARQRGEG
jgi:hypothetical protein